jgi:hypothetical protein
MINGSTSVNTHDGGHSIHARFPKIGNRQLCSYQHSEKQQCEKESCQHFEWILGFSRCTV